MDYQQIAAQLIINISGQHPTISANDLVSGGYVVASGALYQQEEPYKAWLTYRNPREQLLVETPRLRSDGLNWHRLIVEQDMVIHWNVPNFEDTGEVYAYYAPNHLQLDQRYFIAGQSWGTGLGQRQPGYTGHMDRWIVDHNIPGVVQARNGVSIHVTAVPARFAIVVEFLHHAMSDPTAYSKGVMGLEGISGSVHRGAGGGTMLGKVQTKQGTAQYRKVRRILYVEAYA